MFNFTPQMCIVKCKFSIYILVSISITHLTLCQHKIPVYSKYLVGVLSDKVWQIFTFICKLIVRFLVLIYILLGLMAMLCAWFGIFYGNDRWYRAASVL